MLRTKCKCGCEHIIESDKPQLFLNKKCFKCGEPVQFRLPTKEESIKEVTEEKAPTTKLKKRGRPKRKSA